MSVFLDSAPATLANQTIFLSRHEARQILGVSFGCLDAVIRAGNLRVVRVGRRVLIPYQELRRFVDLSGCQQR
jgi:excisionase family DNA binding protein